jgi:hypothetical protein
MDAIVLALDAAGEALQTEAFAEAFVDIGALAVKAVKWERQVIVELRAVGRDTGADGIEGFDRRAFRVVGRLQHQRRHRADENDLGDAR